MALFDRAIVRLLPAVPRPVVEKLSARYIAGSELVDALRVVAEQNSIGKLATIDVLGEDVTSAEEARDFARAYRDVLEAIERDGLDSNISVKPTSLGLRIGYAACRENLETVVRDAAARASFVRIEMEDSSCTDDTLRLYRELLSQGHESIGVVLQAYLRRTHGDARSLADLAPNVRLVKGIYVEPAALAFTDFHEVRASFVRTLEELLAAGAYVGIATHDEWLVEDALRQVDRHGLAREQYEFQMLLGVREKLGDRLVRDGHRLRVYVPYGSQWYAYSLRRLQENPMMAGYIAADVLGRLRPRRDGSA